MPKNCSSDVQAVIKHVDKVFRGTDRKAINDIKENFNLTALTHLDDVAGSRKDPPPPASYLPDDNLSVRNNLWDWQRLQTDSGPNAPFGRFCDALEVKDGQVAGPKGWGLDHALRAWGKFWKDGYLADRRFFIHLQIFH